MTSPKTNYHKHQGENDIPAEPAEDMPRASHGRFSLVPEKEPSCHPRLDRLAPLVRMLLVVMPFVTSSKAFAQITSCY